MVTNNNMPADHLENLHMSIQNFKTDHHKGVFSLFGFVRGGKPVSRITVSVLLTAFALTGCGGDQPREDPDTDYYTDQSSAVFAPDAGDAGSDLYGSTTTGSGDSSGNQGSNGRGDLIGGWSIVLMKIGSDNMSRAQQMLQMIQNDAGLEGAFIEERSEGLVIAYGNYLGREAAEKDLQRIRETKVSDRTPFRTAIITPPASKELRGSNPTWDLRTVKRRYGRQAVYTLQIGVYGRADYQTPNAKDLAEFRKAAEAAVRDLRANGEMAFYYHAPARSMVTVGVFGEKDFDSTVRPPYQSPMLKTVRDRYPNNLLNGQGINETIRTESGRVTQMQSSQLVAIPEN